jgi:SPX domain protein involved in polyphosphate accumulation
MNHEDLIAKMKALTEEIKAREGTLTEDDLGDFLEGVSESLNQVFSLAQNEIAKGIEQIEVAQNCLKEHDMHAEAETISPLINNMVSVRNQLEIGQDVARQKRDFEGYTSEPEPERVLTETVMNNLSGLEQALAQSRSVEP